MSSLSTVLNPASTSTDEQSTSLPPRPDPLNMETNMTHKRKESITSPGLDALAQAASMSPTLRSPTQGLAIGMQSGLDQLGEAAAAAGLGVTFENGGANPSHYENADGPATTQIREPAPGPDANLPGDAVPIAQSEQVQVKTELSDVAMTDAQDPPANLADGVGAENIKSIAEDAKLNTASKPPLKPKAQPKKKAAPKKGTANSVKAPANKKRKLDNTASPISQSPSRALSSTPVPKNVKKAGSATPSRRSSSVAVPDDDGAEYSGSDASDSGELFCICRKPDDHTVMIGCEGPCEDWFHLKCVGMTPAKTRLVAKWYCPNCTEAGFDTLWKRMCRLPGCEEPSRLDVDADSGSKKQGSKYCSDEHGEQFMRRLAFPHAAVTLEDFAKPLASAGTRKKSAQLAALEVQQSIQATEQEDDAKEGDSRGGVLRPGELKALIQHAKSVAEFHNLGSGLVGPAMVNGHSTTTTNAKNGTTTTPKQQEEDPTNLPFTRSEQLELATLSTKRDKLLHRQSLLLDRDKFVLMVEARHKAVWAAMKARGETGKDCCGYDSRLTWSEEEFERWRASPEGRGQFDREELLPPPPPPAQTNGLNHTNGAAAEDVNMENHDENNNNEDEDEDAALEALSRGVCRKKRCERHRQWLRNQQQDNAFEKGGVRVALRKVEAEEKALRDRGRVRLLEGLVGAGDEERGG